MKYSILLLLVCFLSLAAFAEDFPSASVFQMRLVADESSAESEEMVVFNKSDDMTQTETLHVQKRALIDQTSVASARVIRNEQFDFPQIEIAFTESGKKRFAEVTRENIGKRMAVIIAGQLYSAPRVMSEISDGIVVISGSFNKQEAKELVDQITDLLENDEGYKSPWESIRESVVTGYHWLRGTVGSDR